jgi:hypothetical protein
MHGIQVRLGARLQGGHRYRLPEFLTAQPVATREERCLSFPTPCVAARPLMPHTFEGCRVNCVPTRTYPAAPAGHDAPQEGQASGWLVSTRPPARRAA